MNKLVVAVALVALAAHVSADITDTDNVAERLADLDRFIKVDACILAIGLRRRLLDLRRSASVVIRPIRPVHGH